MFNNYIIISSLFPKQNLTSYLSMYLEYSTKFLKLHQITNNLNKCNVFNMNIQFACFDGIWNTLI